jgi:hypothetical protein
VGVVGVIGGLRISRQHLVARGADGEVASGCESSSSSSSSSS